MSNRREFLQLTMAASAWPFIHSSNAQASGPGPAGPGPGYFRAVYDPRIGASTRFANFVASQQVDISALGSGDITAFWFRELAPVWQQTPVPVMGMTTHGPLFCLEQLAGQYGMRVIFRAEHQPEEAGLRHNISGPELITTACQHPEFAADEYWPEQMAALMLACPAGRTTLTHASVQTAAKAFDTVLDQGKLVSWIIAPVRQVA